MWIFIISQHLIRRYLSYSLPSFDIMLDDFDAVDFDMVTSIHDMKDAMSNNLPTQNILKQPFLWLLYLLQIFFDFDLSKNDKFYIISLNFSRVTNIKYALILMKIILIQSNLFIVNKKVLTLSNDNESVNDLFVTRRQSYALIYP